MAKKNKNSNSNGSDEFLESPADLIEDAEGELAEDSVGGEESSSADEPTADKSETGEVGEEERELDPEEKIAELENQAREIHDKLLRTAAELENVRKRARRDVEDAKVFGRTEVLRDILPVIDSLDLALSTADPNGSAGGIVEGVVMVRKQFLNATERYDLKPIETENAAFDPNFHEAVAQVFSDELETGQIVEEVRKGYLLGDRLLRAAMVVVSKGSEKPSTDASSPETEESETENSQEIEPPSTTEGDDE